MPGIEIPAGSRSIYIAPAAARPVRQEEPGSLAEAFVDEQVPGADLFVARVSVGAQSSLHFHQTSELQIVTSGTGVLVDARADEYPIIPGSVIFSPPGPAGAHSLRLNGALPIDVLRVFPSPGGVMPGQIEVAQAGQRTSETSTRVVAPDGGWFAPPDILTAPLSRFLDATVRGANLFALRVAITGQIRLHCHSISELQIVIGGYGLALDGDGGQTPITTGGIVFSPGGLAGAHGFVQTGWTPLELICVYPSPGGAVPDRTELT
jgi:uncharacterized cupin superfamily protein